MKNKDWDWIKKFSKIKVAIICDELGISKNNVLNGRASQENNELVKKAIQERLRELDEEEMRQHIPRID